MNIYQAAKAVAEGRAEGMKRPGWITVLKVTDGIFDLTNLQLVYNLTATDWELVGAKPRTERVEVKRWAKLGADGSWFGSTINSEQAHNWKRNHPDCFIKEISFTFDRPIPEEVTEVERTVAKHQLGYGEMPLPAEWIGKKVRVKLI